MKTTSSTSTSVTIPAVERHATTGGDGLNPGVGAAVGPAGEGGAQLPPSAASPPAGPPRVIPVGREPPRQPLVDHGNQQAATTGHKQAASQPGRTPRDKDRKTRPLLRNPEGFYKYKNRLDEIRVFREETMRHLRRAELSVWLAIHGCQHRGSAQISQARIAEIAGVRRQHVGKAVKNLCEKGLLKVLVTGRYKPNGTEGHGLSSVYRAYPRPEPWLLKSVLPDGEGGPGVGGGADSGAGLLIKKTPADMKPKKPR